MSKPQLPLLLSLGVWWQYNLSASRAVHENISKARKAFFAFGNISVFHGSLNPLSGRSIFETCIVPILLYSCETWIKMLECFQCEIGRRILHLPKHHSNKVVRLGLQWPSVATHILIHKLNFLAKLLANTDDIISSRIFTSLAIVDVYNVGILQQCQMLESELNTNVLALCLMNPENATAIVKSMKTDIIKSDFEVLLSSAATHPSAKYVATVVETTSVILVSIVGLSSRSWCAGDTWSAISAKKNLVVKSLTTFCADLVVPL